MDDAANKENKQIDNESENNAESATEENAAEPANIKNGQVVELNDSLKEHNQVLGRKKYIPSFKYVLIY